MSPGTRQGNKPWKRIYGIDRKYTRRVDRARERGEYTPPTKPPEPREPRP